MMSFLGRSSLFGKAYNQKLSACNHAAIAVKRRCWSTITRRRPVVTADLSSSSSANDQHTTKGAVVSMNGKMTTASSSHHHHHHYNNYFSSVSSTEVAKFNAMHQEWWNAEKNPLIGMNAVRMQYIRQQVIKHRRRIMASESSSSESSPCSWSLPLQGLKALDIGCGGGVACESLVRLGASQVIGLDPSSDLIAAAQQHATDTSLMKNNDNNNTLIYKNMSVEDFLVHHFQETNHDNSHPYYFDVICLLEVLEHVPDKDSSLHSLLSATSQLLHPTRGLLFISTMSPTLQAYALTILGAEYVMRYLPMGTHDFHLYRSPDQVQQIMTAVHLEQVPGSATGMILAGPPPIMGGMGSWNWKLDPNNTQVNWIATYRKPSETNE